MARCFAGRLRCVKEFRQGRAIGVAKQDIAPGISRSRASEGEPVEFASVRSRCWNRQRLSRPSIHEYRPEAYFFVVYCRRQIFSPLFVLFQPRLGQLDCN